MKKLLLFIGLFIIAANQILANHWLLDNDWNIEQYHMHKHAFEELQRQKIQHELLVGSTVRDYDVIRYDFDLDWYNILLAPKTTPEQREWKGEILITVKSKIDNLNVIELDAVDLEILEVYINDVRLLTTPKITDNLLSVPLANPLSVNEQATIKIAYKYVNPKNIGFNLYYKGDTYDGIKVEEQIAYTVNSPEYARYWFPCNDTPGDKAKVSMKVRVPKGFVAAANGNLDSTINIASEDGRNITICYWSDTAQIATFLINATASVYKQYSEWFKSPNRADSIEIKYYIWEQDYDGHVFTAKQTLDRTTKMLEYFSKFFIDYPFCKYGTVEAYPFMYGAMENQTITMVGKRVLQYSLGLSNTVAHEIAHQWFGDLVSSKNWDDIWFKEGAATWSEALWESERRQNEKQYYMTMYNKAKSVLDNPAIFTKPIHGNPSSIFFDVPYVYLTYNKASWIYHQLNVFLGQDVNMPILRKLLTKHQYGNIEAKEFIDLYKEETKNINIDFDVELFFQQWLFKAGYPKYDCNITANKDTTVTDTTLYNVKLILTQTQEGENVSDVFEAPIHIVFSRKNQIVHSQKVINNKRVQEFSFEKIPEFDMCRVDSTKILCKNVNVQINNITDEIQKNLLVYPNPITNQNFVYVLKSNTLNQNIEVFNCLGETVDLTITELSDEYQINVSKIKNGVYFIKIGNKIEKLVVIK